MWLNMVACNRIRSAWVINIPELAIACRACCDSRCLGMQMQDTHLASSLMIAVWRDFLVRKYCFDVVTVSFLARRPFLITDSSSCSMSYLSRSRRNSLSIMATPSVFRLLSLLGLNLIPGFKTLSICRGAFSNLAIIVS